MRGEIQQIIQQYKKLIGEQQRDKEKLAQAIGQQRKIIGSCKNRRAILVEDNNKIFHDFNKVVKMDKQRQKEATKLAKVILSSKKDL